MEGNYKLEVKIGDAVFSADGPESTVREAFEKFLQVTSSMAYSLLHTEGGKAEKGKAGDATERGEHGVDNALLERVFARDDDIVSLRLLPPLEAPNRQADAAILLLYGFRSLLNVQEVPVTRLTKALKKSSISFDRVDRFIGVNSQLFMKGGSRSGTRYTLNTPGIVQAEKWLNSWFK